MFFNLFKKEKKQRTDEFLTGMFTKLKKLYSFETLKEERKEYFSQQIKKYGYLPYPYIKALEELTSAEVLFCLQLKLEKEKVFENDAFHFENSEISALSRCRTDNSNWIKKEQHNIKLINLAALGNGNKTEKTGKFLQWITQLLVLPSGLPEKGIMATTVYLVPFHQRDFECAYLPKSYAVSDKLEDENFKKELTLNVEQQVKLFIQLAQLSGHPVIYDVLPQTGRFSTLVLSNPYLVRWYDIKELINDIENEINSIACELKKSYDEDDVDVIKIVLKNTLNSGSGELSENYKKIYDVFSNKLLERKKVLSKEMSLKSKQEKLVQKVQNIVAKVNCSNKRDKLQESDITEQDKTIKALIDEGLWTIPGGAWCSVGVPIFDKMSECGGYPVFKHFDADDKDVSDFANLDCQTPFFFTYLEDGKYNNKVIDFYVKFLNELQIAYNFDGFRFDHVDHVIDEISVENGLSISYRIASIVLEKVNKKIKSEIAYFVTLAEYMLGGKFYKEYHEDMCFDVLWGNDIIEQNTKTPLQIIEDNQELAHYNLSNLKIDNLSVLKTYNNQDGEFRDINQYPAQLKEAGAIFKWFKLKFLPGGKNASRPTMFVDGDESFTEIGTQYCIDNEVALKRGKNYSFFEKFDAINRFALNNEIIREGEAEIVVQDDDGFVAWLISKDLVKESFLVVANYLPPSEKISETLENGKTQVLIKEGEKVVDKYLQLPCDYQITAEISLPESGLEMIQTSVNIPNNKLHFKELSPSEFKIYKLEK